MGGKRVRFRGLLLAALTAAVGSCVRPGDPAGESRQAPGPVAASLDALAPAAGAADCASRFAAALADSGDGPPVLPVTLRSLGGAGSARLRLDVALASGDEAADCLLVVDRVRLRDATVRELGVETVVAERVVETRRRTNPAWHELDRRLRELRRDASDADGPKILRTGEPTVDLVGLVAGAVLEAVGSFAAPEDEIAALEEQLAQTPRFLDEEIVEKVPVVAQRFEAHRAGSVRLALVDVRRARTWWTEVDLAERKSFLLLPAGAPADVRLPEEPEVVFVRDRAPIERWRRTPPEASLATLAAALAETVRGDGEQLSVAELESLWLPEGRATRWAADGPDLAALEPAAAPPTVGYSASVAVVRDGGRPAALGFQVGPEHLLTLAHTLPRTTLVPVEMAPGLVTYGLVESRDEASDLALLWVPRRGEPLPLATGPDADGPVRRLRPLVEVADGLAGAPLVGGAGVVGLVRSAGKPADVVDVRELRRFLLRARERDGVALAPGGG